MNFYVDSSCFVRLFTRDGPVLAQWGQWTGAFASVLVRVEVRRTFHRLRSDGRFDAAAFEQAWNAMGELEAGIQWLPIRDEVLAMASEPSSAPLKTLDALHRLTVAGTCPP